ncbi:unnamed protein product [Rhizoctonia solani]|nr:unnamed protein product [Rhizoctonia solani]
MHPDGCGCDCLEDAAKLANEHNSTTLLWAFMIRLANEKDSTSPPPPPPTQTSCTIPPPVESGAPETQHTMASQTLTAERVESGSTNDTQEEDQARSTTHSTIPPIATRPSKKPKIKDPNEPKRPSPAYLRYQNAVRDSVKRQFPYHSPTELIQEIAKMWKALPEEERQVHKKYAKAQMDLWMEEVKVYRQGVAAAKSIQPSETQAEGEETFIGKEIARIREICGPKGRVIGAVSGGVDSSVAAKLMHEAIGDRFQAVLVDNGVLRENEAQQVHKMLAEHLGVIFHHGSYVYTQSVHAMFTGHAWTGCVENYM